MTDPTQKPDQPGQQAPRSSDPAQGTSESHAGQAAPDQPQDDMADKPMDTWPLEADRIAINDPLIDCLRIMAGHYGRRTSNASLSAGLPVPKTGITPILFTRAAERAGLHARLVERSIEAVAIAPSFPCVLVLENGQACILWGVKYPQKKGLFGGKKTVEKIHPDMEFIVQLPETEDERQAIRLEQMRELYAGYTFYIRPIARVDDRAGPAVIDNTRDWFWSALWEHRGIYSEVMLAAVMINMFALASSLFVMNVYDRVVPNNAVETLWVLAAGVTTVYIFDLVLKLLRSHFLDHAGRKADVKISAQLFEQMMGMTMEARPASAGVLASNMREFETLRDFFTSATMTALIDLPFIFLFVAIIGVIGGPIAFVPLAAIPIVIGVGFAMQGPLQKVIKASMMESALKNALLFETISGLETIKVQAAEGNTQQKWEELTEKASRTSCEVAQDQFPGPVFCDLYSAADELLLS